LNQWRKKGFKLRSGISGSNFSSSKLLGEFSEGEDEGISFSSGLICTEVRRGMLFKWKHKDRYARQILERIE
jgi:hypothetical protein